MFYQCGKGTPTLFKYFFILFIFTQDVDGEKVAEMREDDEEAEEEYTTTRFCLYHTMNYLRTKINLTSQLNLSGP